MDDKKTQRKERAEIYNHAANAALLVNGGAAVALMAFLQGTQGQGDGLSTNFPFWIGLSLLFLSIGVLAAATINIFRYYASLACEQKRTEDCRWHERATIVAHTASLGTFAVAVAILAAGVLWWQ